MSGRPANIETGTREKARRARVAHDGRERTYTYADDELNFPGGQVVHVRMKVRYADYKLFRGRVRVIEEGDPGDTP